MVNRKKLKTKAKEQLRGQWTVPVLITLFIALIQAAFTLFAGRYKLSNMPLYFALIIPSFIFSLSIAIMTNSFYLKISRDNKVKFSDFLISWKTYFKAMGVQLLVILINIPVVVVISIVFIIVLAIGGVMSMVYSGGFIANPNFTTNSSFMTNSNMMPSVSTILIFAILFMILILILSIPLIILELYLFPSVILMCEDDNRGMWECIKLSFKMMKGNAWSLFVLQLSFIGWALLCVIPMTIILTCVYLFGSDTAIDICRSLAGILLIWLLPYMNTTYLNFYNEISGYTCKDSDSNDITSLS